LGIVDSGWSRSMTGNKEMLDDFVQVKGGIVKFGGGDGRISGRGTIRTSKLDFENVVLRIPRQRDLYTFSISDLQPEQSITCLVTKASLDESTRWHRRMAYVNFKTINKLAKEGLVDGLPLKVLATESLRLLHMDLFGPTNKRSIDQSTICIVNNPVFHQRTKHIEIRHHFIRDAHEKNLIQVLKIHTDDNVVDLLTKAFDGPRFEFLVVHIRMRDQDDWIVSSWMLYTKSTVYVLDLTNGKIVYMFMGSSYPIRAMLLERMLRHRLTVPPSYCRHVRVGGIV
nr:hypothetical protein [Tanacetum cinerariifolium]